MKRSAVWLSLLFVLLLSIFSGCNNPVTTGNGSVNTGNTNAANSGPANKSQPKAAKVYPEMPPVVMNAKLKGLDGKTFTLKDHAGKVILINLWATWCGPCRAEMPELVKVEEEYKDKGLMVIGLDVDPEPEAMVRSFVERQQLNYTIGWIEGEALDTLVDISKMGGIPQSFLITADGKLAGVIKGFNPARMGKDLRDRIDEVLSQASE